MTEEYRYIPALPVLHVCATVEQRGDFAGSSTTARPGAPHAARLAARPGRAAAGPGARASRSVPRQRALQGARRAAQDAVRQIPALFQ